MHILTGFFFVKKIKTKDVDQATWEVNYWQ